MVQKTETTSKIDQIEIGKDTYFRISDSDSLRPFFMSIVSDSDHWMFIASNGGLTAGRKNSDFALFPYYTDDKITESAEITGSKSIFQVHKGGNTYLWEPFSIRFDGNYKVTRNLYKSIYGNRILFEEENHDLNLIFRYEWNSSERFGFVRKACLINTGEEVKISVLDGIRNIMPYGVGSDFQNSTSNLVDAYKRNELLKPSGLGIFALSAIIVDKAEPSEALKANIVWSLGFDKAVYLLSSLQLDTFRNLKPIQEETDIKGEKGAYFIHTQVTLPAGDSKGWMIIADLNQNHSSIRKIEHAIETEKNLSDTVQNDIDLGTRRLIQFSAAADGLQLSADVLKDTRHFSNVLFNIMRGGIFDNNYQVEKWDLQSYLENANVDLAKRTKPLIENLPEVFPISSLYQLARKKGDSDLMRLCHEYLPLKFSRRHGDPSRPWNKFSINTRKEDGSKILDYEGNWRDIFQNWEALAYSFPGFTEGMVHKFLNATTFDGYNPYRVTKGGFDWETIEPDNPWSYIGYWGDHQVIYLLKLLEIMEGYSPGELAEYFGQEVFVYANVPYRIKGYKDILKNPRETIEFDHKEDAKIRSEKEKYGTDAALIRDATNSIYKVNLIEKFLAVVLSKLSNFIPEAGIWMNTQRPEWNDANNALVGYGVSMVTLCYLRRFLTFWEDLLSGSQLSEVNISIELVDCFEGILTVFRENRDMISGPVSDSRRKTFLDGLGKVASIYRHAIYQESFSGEKKVVSLNVLKDFITLVISYIDQTIRANQRVDNLFHSYNLMTVENDAEISVSHLSEMLEGQVAVLSSGYLSSSEALKVLDSLKASSLFREDQYSYILYPNKELPRFMEKNLISQTAVAGSKLLSRLLEDGNTQIVERDIRGDIHFNGNFKNVNDLLRALDKIRDSEYAVWVSEEEEYLKEVFENVFNHKEFTGRSGTFFGYEGLGSIYWHMVSKLELAVQECCVNAIAGGTNAEITGRLLEHYYEIQAGIGIHKSPSLYGAFPTDPYSHTPAGKGAQQPGMTGQVKEDILCRFGELGLSLKEGILSFEPGLLKKDEFLSAGKVFQYYDIHKGEKYLEITEGELCFTICQVPVVYRIADDPGIEVVYSNQKTEKIAGSKLSKLISQKLFSRTGEIEKLIVSIDKTDLR